MSTPTWTTELLPAQFDANVNKHYTTGLLNYLNNGQLLHRRLGNNVQLKNGKWRGSVYALMGDVQEVAEGIEEAPPLRPEHVVDMNARVKLIKGAMIVSREIMEDDAASGAGYINALLPKLAERGPRALEMDFVDTFINRGFEYDPRRDLRDGKALFAVDHTAGGRTYGNMPAVGSALTEDTLAQAIGYFMSGIVGDDGFAQPMVGLTEFDLFVHPDRLLYAQQLTKSLSSTADYKNSGVINPVGASNGFKINVIASPFQTRRNQWTITPVGQESGLLVLVRVPFGAPEKIIRQNPDQVQWQIRSRYQLANIDPRYVYSNPGQ